MHHHLSAKKKDYLRTVLLGISLSVLIISISCKKEDDPGDPSQPLIFSSLVAGKDTIVPGESTEITATASGYKLTYSWSATAGDILGSGARVIYAASPCHAGTNQISCVVRDGNDKSATKEIDIVVE
jgi:hypothetical protein